MQTGTTRHTQRTKRKKERKEARHTYIKEEIPKSIKKKKAGRTDERQKQIKKERTDGTQTDRKTDREINIQKGSNT